MLMTVEEARKRLKGAAKNMTNEEVERLIRDLEALARLCMDMYLAKKRKESLSVKTDVKVLS